MDVYAYLFGGLWLILMLWYIFKKPVTWGIHKISNCLSGCKTALYKLSGLVVFFVLRGKLTVQASTYLLALAQHEATPEMANRTAQSIDTYAALQLIAGALHHSNEVFNGSRLALISEARLCGFRG